MGKGSHERQFKDKAKNRVADLQGMFSDLQLALRESRAGDASVIEEQVHQMLREWKNELNEASPASSVIGNNNGGDSDLSSEIWRLLHIGEEEDDATSKLEEMVGANPKMEPVESRDENGLGSMQGEGIGVHHQQECYVNQEPPKHGFLGADERNNTLPPGPHDSVSNYSERNHHINCEQLHQEMPDDHFTVFDDGGQNNGNILHFQDLSHISDLLPAILPPASAYLKPKCALWDCPRPAQGSEWYQDYCSNFHATLALNEGPPGMTPVLRPGGIDLKDGPLFAALGAKTQGKSVGIPECEGAATAKSPWNAPDLFDLSILEGESLREWLFFDKPRRAFESGSRKQRSLPDYNGRGWHESRKQVMKEFGGLKRSYYMDPQPLKNYEWHLYEYEINNCDACALYRLELKLVDGKKVANKAKVTSDSLVDLQNQMGRLNAETVADSRRSNSKARARANKKNAAEIFYSGTDEVDQKVNDLQFYDGLDQMSLINGNPVYGPSLPYGFSVENLNNYYRT